MMPKGALSLVLMIGTLLHLANGGRSSGQGRTANAGNKADPLNGNDAGIWPGHLEPLGAKAVKRPVPVVDGFLSPKAFYVDHILGSLPVVFRNGAKLSPAFRSWTDQHLQLRPESETHVVDVEIRKKEDRKQPVQRMTFSAFLDRYKTEDEYLVDTLPTFLREDVLLPPPLVCDDIIQRLSDVVMWFSSGGTKSVLHNDDTDNINCLFSGQKEVLFINYTQYRHKVNLDHPEGSYSSLDVDSVDMVKYPGMRDVEFFNAKMFPGDCLYIPYKWIHQVTSVGRNLAVNVWWDHSCEKVPSPEICGSPDRRLTIADVEFGVERPLGFEEDFGENDPSAYEDFINTLVKDKERTITEEALSKMIKTQVPMLNSLTWNEECDELAHEAFELLDLAKDSILDKDDFTSLKDMDEVFHFQLESKFLMLSDIAHEQEVQERLRAYEIERKKKPKKEKDPLIEINQVEPLDLDSIDWGEDDHRDKQKKVVTLEENDINENVKKPDSAHHKTAKNDVNSLPDLKVEL